MKSDVAEQVKKILEGIYDPEELAEIERVIGQVKGKMSLQEGGGFWEGKTPCWEMNHCPDMIKNDCPAFKDQSEACWTVPGTYCKLTDYGARGDDTSICEVCRVYKRCGAGQPIELKTHEEAKVRTT